MYKPLFFVLLLISLGIQAREIKKLHLNYNESVTIWISNEVCPVKKLVRDFPWKAEAVRKDGEVLLGCFTGADERVMIQWKDGDYSIFPANAFLLNLQNNGGI